MAASFDVGQYTKMKGICAIIVLVCMLTAVSGKRRKHPPVQAFFQGDCRHYICEQTCRDIDNGGYACECHQGYRLDHNGITCSKDTKDHLYSSTYRDKDAPVEIKIVYPGEQLPTDSADEPHSSHTHSTQHLILDSSFLKPIPSESGSSIDISKSEPTDNVRVGNADINILNKGEVTPDSDISTPYNTDNVVLGTQDTSLHSIKIVTLDDKPEAPSLETEDLTSSESRNNEHLQNLVPNPLPKYSHHSVVSLSERCDEFSCLNDGKCVDDGTVYREKVRCDCQLGTHGEKCQHVVDVRFPRFYGNSFLALPVLKDGYKELDILIEFKPTIDSGLLFLSSEFEDARSDFFSIALVGGFVELRYDCGTGMGLVRSRSPVAVDTWNIVKVHREDSEATLWLNHDEPVHGNSQGSYSRLTLRLPLYVGGYDNIDWVKDKVGTSQGLVGCVEEVIVNGYKYDLRKAGLVGDAQFGINIGECSDGLCDDVVCENGGKCKVTSADTHICQCPLGTGGENCQHNIDVHIPEFQGHSYLELEGLGRTSLLFLEMELIVKATGLNGLILYNGYTLDRSGDFISLALHNGHLEYRFDLGTGPAVIRSAQPIQLNQWHWIKISRTGMEGILEVDDQVTAIGQSQGAFTQLTVVQRMFIGGHRNFDETSKFANVSRSFDGCIQKLVINSHHVHLMKAAISGVNVENCEHPCIGGPCLNGGQCEPRRDVYTCLCPLGYRGHNCQRKINKEIESPKFSSESFLKFTQKDIAKRVGGDKIDLQFAIKADPAYRDGLFFWSGPDVMKPTSDYIALGFKAGALQFRYNLGSGEAVISYNNSKLFDGLWHFIHAQRDKQDGYLSIDDREIVEGSSKGSYTMLNTNKVVYIGGMSNIEQGTLRKFTTGYRGCLHNFKLGGYSGTQILSSADSGQNIVPCS